MSDWLSLKTSVVQLWVNLDSEFSETCRSGLTAFLLCDILSGNLQVPRQNLICSLKLFNMT